MEFSFLSSLNSSPWWNARIYLGWAFSCVTSNPSLQYTLHSFPDGRTMTVLMQTDENKTLQKQNESLCAIVFVDGLKTWRSQKSRSTLLNVCKIEKILFPCASCSDILSCAKIRVFLPNIKIPFSLAMKHEHISMTHPAAWDTNPPNQMWSDRRRAAFNVCYTPTVQLLHITQVKGGVLSFYSY